MSNQDAKGGLGWSQPVLYSSFYIWFLVLSACDVLFTWTILQAGGSEMNPVAQRILEKFGAQGMVAYKFLLVTLVVCLCETIGQQRQRWGRAVATLGVLLTMVPVGWSFCILVYGR
jgi:hypothetical protein